jgi:hypothetical protein
MGIASIIKNGSNSVQTAFQTSNLKEHAATTAVKISSLAQTTKMVVQTTILDPKVRAVAKQVGYGLKIVGSFSIAVGSVVIINPVTSGAGVVLILTGAASVAVGETLVYVTSKE